MTPGKSRERQKYKKDKSVKMVFRFSLVSVIFIFGFKDKNTMMMNNELNSDKLWISH